MGGDLGGRERHRLTLVAVKAAGPGTLHDGGGLLLERGPAGGSWVFRYSFGGKRREMGLGPWPELSIADARKARERWASVLAHGRDPILERDREREVERLAASRRDPTLEEAVAETLDAIKAKLRGDGERGRWRSPLDTHVLPVLGRRRLSTLGAADLRDALKPIWRTKHPTAEKAIQRLAIVFRRGELVEWPCHPLTVEKAREMLGVVRHKRQSIATTPWRDLPDLYARLDNGGPVHLCLRLLMLTAVRSDAGRGLRFSEVDGDVWTVPAERMKGMEGVAEDFRVPLSPAVLDVLREAQETAQGPFAFASHTGNPVTTTALQKALNALGEAGRPHGFRSSFKDWTRETGLVAWEVAEAALAHQVGGEVERSYARSDLLDRRREAMDLWARHITGA